MLCTVVIRRCFEAFSSSESAFGIAAASTFPFAVSTKSIVRSSAETGILSSSSPPITSLIFRLSEKGKARLNRYAEPFSTAAP